MYHCVQKGSCIIVCRRAHALLCVEGLMHYCVQKGSCIIVCRRAHVLLCVEGLRYYCVSLRIVVSSILFYRMFLVPCCDVRYDFRIKRCSVRLYLLLFCSRTHIIFMLFVFVCVLWCTTRLNYLNKMAGVLQEAGTAYPSRAHGFTPGFDGVHVDHLFCFLCCVFCFDSLRTLSCVPNVTSVTELFILDLSFEFL